MKIHAVCSRYIVFTLPSSLKFDKEDARSFINSLLLENSLPPWSSICIDIFTSDASDGGLLCLAYPKYEQKISLASYAIPFLADYFTE